MKKEGTADDDHSNGNQLALAKRPAGIKDIAKALGVSIGTVDRALHGRAHINEQTRSRVLKMAETLGYRPNFAARSLKLNRKLRIAVHLPRELADFFDTLRKGVSDAAIPFQAAVTLEFRSQPRLGEGDVELFEQALADGTSGIILAPGHPREISPWIRRAAEKNIPVVCVATDAPQTERLTAISADAHTSGAMVAQLLDLSIQEPGEVLIVTGDLSTFDHAEKLRGFREFLTGTSKLRTGPVLEAHDDPAEAYRSVRERVACNTRLRAVYVTTANSLTTIKALEESGSLAKLKVVTTDLFPSLAPLIREGKVMGTIYQRPHTQGQMAFLALHQFLTAGQTPPPNIKIVPHIILRSNLGLLLEIVSSGVEGASEASSTGAGVL